MRTLLGPAATAIARRGLGLERAAMITLRRDAYAVPPGPTLGLAIGERTTYRPGAWLLDTFERDALGAAYPAWGGSAGLTLGAGGVTAAVGPVGMATHPARAPARCLGRRRDRGARGRRRRGPPAPARPTTRPTATGSRRRRPLTVVERLAAGRGDRPGERGDALAGRGAAPGRLGLGSAPRLPGRASSSPQVTDARAAPSPAAPGSWSRRGDAGRPRRRSRAFLGRRGAAGVARRRPRSRATCSGSSGSRRRSSSRCPTWRRWAGPSGSRPSSGTGSIRPTPTTSTGARCGC